MRKVNLLNYNFNTECTLNEIAKQIIEQSANKSQLVVTPNAYIIQLLAYSKYEYLERYVQSADFILPDGMPIVWLSKLIYPKSFIQQRITGSDLFPILWESIKEKELPVTVIAPNEQTSALFLDNYPGKCNTIIPKFFNESDLGYIQDLARATWQKIKMNNSRFLFIGISDPKQSLLSYYIQEIAKEEVSGTKFTTSLLGASFEFYFGRVKRAPKWIQHLGFEWLYRFVKEPRRLWKRYTLGNLRFLKLALEELWKKKFCSR